MTKKTMTAYDWDLFEGTQDGVKMGSIARVYGYWRSEIEDLIAAPNGHQRAYAMGYARGWWHGYQGTDERSRMAIVDAWLGRMPKSAASGWRAALKKRQEKEAI